MIFFSCKPKVQLHELIKLTDFQTEYEEFFDFVQKNIISSLLCDGGVEVTKQTMLTVLISTYNRPASSNDELADISQ